MYKYVSIERVDFNLTVSGNCGKSYKKIVPSNICQPLLVSKLRNTMLTQFCNIGQHASKSENYILFKIINVQMYAYGKQIQFGKKKNAGSADLKAGGDSRVKNASCA